MDASISVPSWGCQYLSLICWMPVFQSHLVDDSIPASSVGCQYLSVIWWMTVFQPHLVDASISQNHPVDASVLASSCWCHCQNTSILWLLPVSSVRWRYHSIYTDLLEDSSIKWTGSWVRPWRRWINWSWNHSNFSSQLELPQIPGHGKGNKNVN